MVEISPINDRIGAVVKGVDVKALSAADFGKLYEAWMKHIVLVIPGQDLDIPQYLAYSNRWGKVIPHISNIRHPDYPELTLLGVKPPGAAPVMDHLVHARGEVWHSDTPYWEQPCKATQLYAREIPSYGGDTQFASMYDAYDALPERLKQRIEGLSADYKYSGREGKYIHLINEADRKRPPVSQPIVRVHPETGRRALYVIPIHCMGIVGMPEAEGDALLQELYGYMVQPNSQYRHKWTVGDIVIWDNRCAIHQGAGGHPLNEKRIHWRVTIMDYEAQAARASA